MRAPPDIYANALPSGMILPRSASQTVTDIRICTTRNQNAASPSQGAGRSDPIQAHVVDLVSFCQFLPLCLRKGRHRWGWDARVFAQGQWVRAELLTQTRRRPVNSRGASPCRPSNNDIRYRHTQDTGEIQTVQERELHTPTAT